MRHHKLPDYQVVPPDEHFYDPLYTYEPPDSPRRMGCLGRAVRLALVLVMIGALVGGLAWRAWDIVPQVLGYWDADYTLILRTVYAGPCDEFSGGNGGDIRPAREMCVCGDLLSDDQTAHVEIELQSPQGGRLTDATLYDQPAGAFCQTLSHDELLTPGRYRLVATPRLSRQPIARMVFDVRDNRPDI
jgi:hypothetical protein